jgi:Chloroplast import apparatus Tic20-like
MTWRGTTDTKDRLLAALVYILPILSVLEFGIYLFREFPILQLILIPLSPLIRIYSYPFAGIIVFFILFLAVVRNEKVAHFIRFNTMQAILIDVLIFLVGFLVQILSPALGQSFLLQTLYNVIFLGTIASCVYSMVQSVLGRYAEIPTISEAAYSQVR